MQTLTYYSIAPDQLARFLDKLSEQGAACAPTEAQAPTVQPGMIAGKTPLGDIKATFAYVPGSGQLTVEVSEKPMLIKDADVEHFIRMGLESAREEPKGAPAGGTGETTGETGDATPATWKRKWRKGPAQPDQPTPPDQPTAS